ncbi:Ca(2+)-dependent cysteine protease [Spiromyces aspiralis]|uniref:Ca(2+)-dependent cysteine protease n=1 Tax=Spiromyces aspiralis TaxID=68401 RepID=A0ACC1HL83_9FUNG|nr:Ca(2+)-dependent cysteine protease [Spiromyces aspiralis]
MYPGNFNYNHDDGNNYPHHHNQGGYPPPPHNYPGSSSSGGGFPGMPAPAEGYYHHQHNQPPPPPPYYEDQRSMPPPPPPPGQGGYYPSPDGGFPPPPPPPHSQGGYYPPHDGEYQQYPPPPPPPHMPYHQQGYLGEPENIGSMVPMGGDISVNRPDLSQYSFQGMDFPSTQNMMPPPPPPPSDPTYFQGQPTHGNIAEFNHVAGELLQQSASIQLSNCQGRRRALLIGINYINNPKYRLRGCINDVHNMKRFLIEHFRFRESDMVILTDDQDNPKRIPTRDNILRAMKWLVDGAHMNDSFFFHYSGHGTTIKDTSGDEIDGYDEVICPADFTDPNAGYILDDDMNEIMVRSLPPGARLTAIFDCCHSASALDLPFMYDHTGKLKNETAVAVAAKNLRSSVEKFMMSGDMAGILGGLVSSAKIAITGDEKIAAARRLKSTMGDVIMFSGCKDSQTSADAKSNMDDLRFVGAMSHAFVSSLNEQPHQTYVQLLQDVRKRLQEQNFTQVPQLSSGRLMNMNTIFIM